jgi:hypothetical protein
MDALENTSVPTPFVLEASYESDDVARLEVDIHQLLHLFRVSTSREFFQLSTTAAKAMIEGSAIIPSIGPKLYHAENTDLDILKVGKVISAQRRALNLSQRDLATRSRLGFSTLQALETGKLGELGFTKITRVLRSMGLHLQVVTTPTKRPTLEDLLAEPNPKVHNPEPYPA